MSEKILLRPSEVNCYVQCSAKYRFQYVDRIQVPKALALAFGSSVHSSLEKNYRQKIETREDLSVEEVVQEFSDAFDRETQEVEKVELLEEPESKDIGIKLVGCYHRKIAPILQPKAVEHKVEATYKGYDYGITGTIDLLTENLELHDHKTAGKRMSAPPDSHVRQGSAYHLMATAIGEKIKSVSFDYLVKKKNPEVYSAVIQTDPMYFLKLAQVVGEAVQRGVFIPNRDSVMCNKRFCKYFAVCEKSYGGRVKP